jgi:DNA replication protein DnaC
VTPEEIRGEAAAIWLAEHRQRLVDNLLTGRPAEMAAAGELDPDIAAWSKHLAAGGSKQNLILTGTVGAGKTWAAWKAAETAVRAGYEALVVITTAARFRRVIAPSTAEPREFVRYCAAGLLVLDDVAALRLSEWDLDHLAELTDIRWSEQRPTVVTSNKTNLGNLLGPRISSRLQHNALRVPLDSPDRRRQS